MMTSNQGPETCNTYNMLRLTKGLFLDDPDAGYLNYFERALYNHILSSKHPKGGYVYFTPMRPQHYRVFSQPHTSFWCCVGSGMENHAKYGEMIYLHNEKDVFVNFFIPSVLHWADKGVTLTQQTTFPYEESTSITVNLDSPEKFALNIRIPEWVTRDGFSVSVNGREQQIRNHSGIYTTISRRWSDSDVITVTLPMQTSVEYLPDGSSWASIVHGPVVLAAITGHDDLDGLFADDSRMGHEAQGKYYPIETSPVIVSRDKDFSSAVEPCCDRPLAFSIQKILGSPEGETTDLTLIPFYEIHEARYMIYWPVVNPDESE